MELIQLEAFLTITREGSFTRAADVLGLTQPSVSARIALLEAELGGQLFERGSRTLKLTLLGELFQPYAERSLLALADGREAAKRYQAGKRGFLNIAALDLPAQYLLPAPLERFRSAYPEVDVRLVLRTANEILELLRSGPPGLGLTGTRFIRRDMHIHARFTESIRAVASPRHPLAQLQAERGALEVSDLYDHTIFRVTLNRQTTMLVENIAEAARGGSGGAYLHMPWLLVVPQIIFGHGVTFFPETAMQRHIDNGDMVFLNIRDLNLTNELLLVSNRERELDLPSQRFIEMFRVWWRAHLVD